MVSTAVPTGDAAIVVATEGNSEGADTGGDTVAVAAGIALSESEHATETADAALATAENATETSVAAADMAQNASGAAFEAQDTAAVANERIGRVETGMVAMAETLNVHSQALAALLEQGQTAKTPAPSNEASGPDSEPKPRHWLEKTVGKRKR